MGDGSLGAGGGQSEDEGELFEEDMDPIGGEEQGVVEDGEGEMSGLNGG